jgi:hypothetical protein
MMTGQEHILTFSFTSRQISLAVLNEHHQHRPEAAVANSFPIPPDFLGLS